MATATLLSVEEYLATHYEREPEYVRGELRERPMPNPDHGFTQVELGHLVRIRAPHLYVGSEIRHRVEPEVLRLPDIAIYVTRPKVRLPTEPPLAAIEILSPDEKFSELREKFAEYERWGVRYIWLVDPESRTFSIYRGGSLLAADQLEVPEHNLTITIADLFPEER
ncbi:MAG: Uma2 family endonuclease [Bryobacteraceae bacterium]|nr:Uma2 family endonuclease [Bryobacteraceae bacterium]